MNYKQQFEKEYEKYCINMSSEYKIWLEKQLEKTEKENKRLKKENRKLHQNIMK